MKEVATPSLTKLSLIYSGGSFLSKGISFLVFFLITYYLTQNDLGYYDLILTSIMLAMPIISLQLQDSLLRWFIVAKSKREQKRILSSIVFALIVSISFFILIYCLFIHIVDVSFSLSILLLIIAQVVFAFVQQVLRGIGQNISYTLSGIAYSSLLLMSTVLILSVFKGDIGHLLFSNALVSLLVSIVFILKNKIYKYFNRSLIDINLIKDLVHYSLPLLPNTISWWLISSANRYLIILFLGYAANGIFAVSFKIPSMILLVTTIFQLAWQEKAIKHYSTSQSSNDYINTVLLKFLKILFSISILAIVFSKFIIIHIVDKTFINSWKYIPILIIGVFFQALSSFFGVSYLIVKNTKGAFTSSVYSGVISVIISSVFIYYFHLYGAAIGIASGYVIMFVIRNNHSRKYLNIKIPFFKSIFYLAYIFIATSVVYFADDTINYIIMLSTILVVAFEIKDWVLNCIKK